jgi:hypothetical protein
LPVWVLPKMCGYNVFFCALAISPVCSALNYEKRPWTSPIHSCTLRVHIRWSGLDRGQHRAGRLQSAHTSPQRFICNIDFSFHALYNVTLGDIGSTRLVGKWKVMSSSSFASIWRWTYGGASRNALISLQCIILE